MTTLMYYMMINYGYVIVIYDSEHNNKYIKYILQQILNNNLRDILRRHFLLF